MSGVVGIAPLAAAEVVDRLRLAGRDLEGLAEDARALLVQAQRTSTAPAVVADVAVWSRALAADLSRRIERIVSLDAASPLGRGHGSLSVHLDLRRADGVDDLLSLLSAAGLLPGCVPHDDPRSRHRALAGLPEDVLATLLRQVPQLLARTDGVPFGLRDRANRRLLQEHIARLDHRRRRLVAGLRRQLRHLDIDDVPAGGAPSLHRRLLAARVSPETWLLVTRAQRQLDEQDRLRALLAGWRDDPDLLVVRLDVDAGRAVLARGDLDAASHVATIVPGANTTLETIGGTYTGWMERLHRVGQQRLDLDNRGGTLATVLWLDMDAPVGLVPAAMGSGPADDAATRLPPFLAGVAAVDRDVVTTIGHSYGSVVLGRSLASHPGRLDSDQLVALGSPGMGVQRGGQLGLHDDQRLYASTLAGDPIAAVGTWNPVTGDLGRVVHGPDPRRLAGVETIALPVHDLPLEGTRVRRAADRHMQYLDDGSVALGTFADLVAGRHRFADRQRRR
jgi:hypothetical protein